MIRKLLIPVVVLAVLGAVAYFGYGIAMQLLNMM